MNNMNQLKKILGIVWLLVAPFTMYFLIKTALREISLKPVIDTKIQWGVFILIFIPIGIGLMIFGYYCVKGEYSHLPKSSAELED
jgi:purine-cytosine permease-like protein